MSISVNLVSKALRNSEMPRILCCALLQGAMSSCPWSFRRVHCDDDGCLCRTAGLLCVLALESHRSVVNQIMFLELNDFLVLDQRRSMTVDRMNGSRGTFCNARRCVIDVAIRGSSGCCARAAEIEIPALEMTMLSLMSLRYSAMGGLTAICRMHMSV